MIYVTYTYVTGFIKTVPNHIFGDSRNNYQFEILNPLWFSCAIYMVAMLDLQYN